MLCTALTPCKHTVSGLFHRPFGLLFTFPSRYLFTIGLLEYLALPVSSGRFTPVLRFRSYSRTIKKLVCFRVRDYYPLGLNFPVYSTNKPICIFSRLINPDFDYSKSKQIGELIVLQPPSASRYARCFKHEIRN